MIIAGTAATLALAGSSFALGAGTQERAAIPQPVGHTQPLPKSLSNLAKATRVRVRCGNIQCVNGALTAIGKAFRHMTGCIDYINIARYDGYLYSNDGGATSFTTTGFDEAEPGEQGTRMAILTC
jgi:hypothetical protein